MSYTFEQLKEDVRKEAEALRVHATKEELGRLDISTFSPYNIHGCIYGLTTKSCHSERAKELIMQCASKFVIDGFISYITDDGFARIEKHISDKPSDFLSGRGFEGYYTVLEAYILLPEARNVNLIAFLRGETNNLEL